MSEQPVDPRLLEQTRQQIRQLVAEIEELAESDVPPPQFYDEFLQRVVAAVAAVGGALWTRDDEGPPRLQQQINFDQSGLLDDTNRANGHIALLLSTFQDGMAKLVPPHTVVQDERGVDSGANASDLSLVLAPITINQATVGMVELLLDPDRRRSAQENAVRFVNELCEIGASYLKNRKLRQMMNQQQLWSRLESFTRQIHSSLVPKEVAYIIANEGKRLVGCDRLSVAIVYGRKPVVEGVSGQEVVERRSNLVQLMTRLCNTVLRSKEDLLYGGQVPEGLPPAVHDALDAYLIEGQSKVLVAALLRQRDEEDKEGEPFGLLLAEQLKEATSAEDLAAKVEVISQHAAGAIANALTYHRIFLLPLWRGIGRALKWMRGNRLAKLAVAVAVVTTVTLALVFVPKELRLEGRGELLPEVRRNVYAPEQAEVASVLVDHGQLVARGQVLLQMHSPELEQQRIDLRNQLQQAYAEYDYGAERSREDLGTTKSRALARINSFTAQLRILDRRLDSLQLKAPTPGMIATWDPKVTLRDRPVNRGDPLLEIWDVENRAANGQGHWILRVKMPEHRVGYIHEAQRRRAKDGRPKPLSAVFILASYPEKRLRAHVKKIYTSAELDKDEKEHVVPIDLVPDGVKSFRVIKAPMEGNPKAMQVTTLVMTLDDGTRLLLSPGAEVRAKVECGKRALGFVLLRELIEFFYEVVLF